MTSFIDINKCQLTLENPFVIISSETKLSDLEKMKDYEYFTSSNKKYHNCIIGSFSIYGMNCSPRIYFENNKITLIKFKVCPFDKGGWDDWSEENQIRYKEWHDEWLFKHIGKRPPYKSKNGIIDSVYDMKSADSYIYFSYPQNRGKS